MVSSISITLHEITVRTVNDSDTGINTGTLCNLSSFIILIQLYNLTDCTCGDFAFLDFLLNLRCKVEK